VTTVERAYIADGDDGVRQTVARIAQLIREGVANPVVRRAVTDLVGALSPNDYLGQLYAIREWCASHIHFLRDPAGVELLHSPEWLLRTIASDGAAYVDCDDAAILGGAMCGAIGMQVALITVAFLDSGAPFSHIWASASPPVAFLDAAGKQQWIELDVTRPMQDIPLSHISRSEVVQVL
jgi:hypothetical protein